MARRDSLVEFLSGNPELAKISVSEANGSTPRESGAWMVVSASGQAGTIGGGQLEKMATEEARKLLDSASNNTILDVPLGPEIGQCCGGHVKLAIERLDDPARLDLARQCRIEFETLPRVYVFGAGHVGKALAEALALLPVRPLLVETRASELDAATDAVDKCLTAVPESVISDAPPGSAYVVLTHDHALDFLIADTALARIDAAYVGMIGSKTKLARFKSWMDKESISGADATRLVCPIGGSAVRDKRPQIIAALVATEIIAALFPSATV